MSANADEGIAGPALYDFVSDRNWIQAHCIGLGLHLPRAKIGSHLGKIPRGRILG